MSNKPSVTVVVPVYNTPVNLVARAIDSALTQLFVNLIIVVDDGSDSGYSAGIERVARQDSRILVLHQSHKGVSEARNLALENITGNYVAFLDADDELEEGFFQSAITHLETTGAQIAIGGITMVYNTGATSALTRFDVGTNGLLVEHDELRVLQRSLFDPDAISELGIQPTMFGSNCGVLYSASVVRATRYRTEIAISEDRLFNFDVLNNCNRAVLVDEPWYKYLQNEGSATQTARKDAHQALVNTAHAIGNLKQEDDVVLNKSLDRGILECFIRTLEYSVLRKDYSQVFSVSKTEFVSGLINEQIYIDAFSNCSPSGIKYQILKRCVAENHPKLLLVLAELNNLIFRLKHFR